jgi:hypothetical protein
MKEKGIIQKLLKTSTVSMARGIFPENWPLNANYPLVFSASFLYIMA